MFIAIRKYKVQRGTGPGLAQRVQDGFVPLMRQMHGFRGYHLLDGGPDILVSVTMFDNAEEALASSEAAADWVRDNVLEFTRGMPEVTVGHALISEPEPEDDPP
ncbi:MAG TPA: antibiotic biosynthesis monooxygenase [Acetobacteraceae bacterium]|nr:antibiotic biosynthesis monooxygenase [Acetobacteraceae bacterium]